ncbi:Uncharacterised protein [Mycobacterium tuberculosis]|nr:Uncharacterised protein [Mycobacterium tuberculosis]
MCCSAMSASVAWVAIRTEVTPRSWAATRSWAVPIPGSSRVVNRAFVTTSAAAVIHCASVELPGP